MGMGLASAEQPERECGRDGEGDRAGGARCEERLTLGYGGRRAVEGKHLATSPDEDQPDDECERDADQRDAER